MTFETYLSRLEIELNQKTTAYINLEQTLFKDVTISNLQQIHDFICKKIELEEIEYKYHTLKLLIYKNGIKLKARVSHKFIADHSKIFTK